MPIYVYRCPECFDSEERIERLADELPPPICSRPICQHLKIEMRRVIAASTVIVKGFNAKNGYSK